EAGLALRVPGWSPAAELTLNGAPAPTASSGGYLILTRQWQAGDTLALDLDLSPRLTFPGRRFDALRGTAAVERGPLVYCFEQADQDSADVEDLALSGAVLSGPAVAGAAVSVA